MPQAKLPLAPFEAQSTVRTSGFFDLQANGFGGVDFQRSDLTARDLDRAVKALHSHQTGRILLTLITDRVDALCKKLDRIETMRRKNPYLAATVVGYHLEGPYLLPLRGYSGAHDSRLMRPPNVAEFRLMWEAGGGNIRLLTMAPELPGSPEFIRHLSRLNVRIAVGHSNADEHSIDEAIAAGLSLCTHLGNGVPLELPRHDNVIQRLLARDELYASFIPDGIHLPPFVLQNLVRAKPENRVLFTTDCMAAAGSPPGTYRLGKLVTRVGADGVVRLPGETKYFAGSSLTMASAAQNVQRLLGWSEVKATAACSTHIATFLGFSSP